MLTPEKKTLQTAWYCDLRCLHYCLLTMGQDSNIVVTPSKHISDVECADDQLEPHTLHVVALARIAAWTSCSLTLSLALEVCNL